MEAQEESQEEAGVDVSERVVEDVARSGSRLATKGDGSGRRLRKRGGMGAGVLPIDGRRGGG